MRAEFILHPRNCRGCLVDVAAWLLSGCGGSYEETISGVTVPVPKAMTKNSEKPAEISFLGFGAGQASFHGSMETDKSSSSTRKS